MMMLKNCLVITISLSRDTKWELARLKMNPKFSIFLDFLFLALTPTSRAPEIEAGVRGVQVEGKTVRLCDCRYLYWLLVIGIGYCRYL